MIVIILMNDIKEVAGLENIGLILKNRREELGYSLEDVSIKTKLSTIQLNAIEEGNIQFFKDDLSYLSYFVRYYANALDLNYDELRDSLDETINEFTHTMSVTQIQKNEDINNNIQNRVKKSVVPTKVKKSKGLDLKSFGLISFVIIISGLLVFAFFTKILPMIQDAQDPINKPEVIVRPQDENDTETETKEPEKKPEETAKKVVIKKIDAKNYEVSGFKPGENVVFDLKIANASWIEVYENTKRMANPVPKVYQPNEEVKVIVQPQKDTFVEILFGYAQGNGLTINGETVEVDESVSGLAGKAKLNFKFVEE